MILNYWLQYFDKYKTSEILTSVQNIPFLNTCNRGIICIVQSQCHIELVCATRQNIGAMQRTESDGLRVTLTLIHTLDCFIPTINLLETSVTISEHRSKWHDNLHQYFPWCITILKLYIAQFEHENVATALVAKKMTHTHTHTRRITLLWMHAEG